MESTRLEAELVALRRAQSIFGESSAPVSVLSKLEDLQEMYIGDLLVKDCQISQYKSQIDNLMTEMNSVRSQSSAMSTPVNTAVNPATSILTSRLQSLQKSLTQERHRREEAESKLEETTTRLTASHRLEVSQLKSRLHAVSETNRKLQDRLDICSSKKAVPMTSTSSADYDSAGHATMSGTPKLGGSSTPGPPCSINSPTNSAKGADKVPYVKYAQLRSEKRHMESKLTAQIENLRAEKDSAISGHSVELEKLKDHQRRVVADMERKIKLAESSRVEESREIKELRAQLADVVRERDELKERLVQMGERNNQLISDVAARQTEIEELMESEKYLSTELEERERLIVELEKSAHSQEELDKLRDERLDLLERIEEREDMLKALQDDAEEKQKVLTQVSQRLTEKEREIEIMISQAEELDGLLNRADGEMAVNREKVLTLEAENAKLQSEITRLNDLVKAVSLNAEQVTNSLKSVEQSRIQALIEEKAILTEKVENLTKQLHAADSPENKQQLVETKFERLETELKSLRKQLAAKAAIDSSNETSTNDTPPLTGSVLIAENMFHDAVDLCAEGQYSRAVSLLEEASGVLSRLSKSEFSQNDPSALKILESDIYGQLGVAFQSLSQVPEAVEAYTTAVDVDPQAHACHANLAVLLHHQSRSKEAESHAKLAVQLAPEIEEYQSLLQQIKSGAADAKVVLRSSTKW